MRNEENCGGNSPLCRYRVEYLEVEITHINLPHCLLAIFSCILKEVGTRWRIMIGVKTEGVIWDGGWENLEVSELESFEFVGWSTGVCRWCLCKLKASLPRKHTPTTSLSILNILIGHVSFTLLWILINTFFSKRKSIKLKKKIDTHKIRSNHF